MAYYNYEKVSDENLRLHYGRMQNLHTYTMTEELRRQYLLQTIMEEAQHRGIEEQL